MRHIRDVEKLNTPSLLHLLQKKKKKQQAKIKTYTQTVESGASDMII